MSVQTDTRTSHSPYRLAAEAEITAVKSILGAAGLLGETKRIAYLGFGGPRPERCGGNRGTPVPGLRARRFRGASVGRDRLGVQRRGDFRRRAGYGGDRRASCPGGGVRGRRGSFWPRTSGGSGRWPTAAWTSARSALPRCQPGCSSTRRRRAAGSCVDWPSCRISPRSSAWAHPVDGLVAYVDVVAKTVTQVLEPAPCRFPQSTATTPIRSSPVRCGPRRNPSPYPAGRAQLHGHRRQPRRMGKMERRRRLRRPRRGGAAQPRLPGRRAPAPIINRASIAEMVVPYAEPAPIRSWQNYFDTGEYLVGQYANSLELGCDCLGEITYLMPGHQRRVRQPPGDPQRPACRGRLGNPEPSTATSGRASTTPAATAAW